MENFTIADLIPRLQSEYKYPSKGAQTIAEKLVMCQPAIKIVFLKWWRTGEFTPLEIEGYTWKYLMEKQSMNPIAALLTLDWLLREPDKAKKSLHKGHDEVRLNKDR